MPKEGHTPDRVIFEEVYGFYANQTKKGMQRLEDFHLFASNLADDLFKKGKVRNPDHVGAIAGLALHAVASKHNPITDGVPGKEIYGGQS